MTDIVTQAYEVLQGTCKSEQELQQALEISEERSLEIIAELEKRDLLFRCSQCSWWVEPDEVADDEDEIVCDDCIEGDFDDF